MVSFRYKEKRREAKTKKQTFGGDEKGVSPLDKAEHPAEQFHTGFVSQKSCERNPMEII